MTDDTKTTITMTLGWVIAYVDDPPAAAAFYADTFGLKTEFVAPGGSYAQLDTGATKLAFASYALGEGRIDEQSVMGKIVGEIGDRALAAGVPLFAIVGRDSVPPEAAERIALRGVREATTLAGRLDLRERVGREIAQT